jgi:hypothetical protein
MGNRSASFHKRQREITLKEKAKEKVQRRAERERTRTDRAEGGEDPDIAGIVPGPQPPTSES